MSGDTTIQMLKRLSFLSERSDNLNGDLIGGQNYYDVFFTGGTISGVTLSDVNFSGGVSLVTTVTSDDYAVTTSGTFTFTHNLGSIPLCIQMYQRCLTAEHGYSIGDVVNVTTYQQNGTGSFSFGVSATTTASALICRYGNNAQVLYAQNKTTGAPVSCTNANWNVFIKVIGT